MIEKIPMKNIMRDSSCYMKMLWHMVAKMVDIKIFGTQKQFINVKWFSPNISFG
jgi:hypothetical protein